MSDRIEIDGIEFYGFHGASEAEREIGHRFRADVVLELDLAPAGQSDDLELTAHYGIASQLVAEIGTGPSVKLVETLAERMAARLLEQFPPVRAVEVRVAKLLPPISLTVAACAIRIRRERLSPG